MDAAEPDEVKEVDEDYGVEFAEEVDWGVEEIKAGWTCVSGLAYPAILDGLSVRSGKEI